MMSASGRGVQKAMLSVAIKIMNPRPILSAGNVQFCHVWGHPLTVQALLLLLLFILLWLCWLPVALHRLSLVAKSRGLPFPAMRQLLVAVPSLVAEHRLQAQGLQ